jgi:hypothetical protein
MAEDQLELEAINWLNKTRDIERKTAMPFIKALCLYYWIL